MANNFTTFFRFLKEKPYLMLLAFTAGLSGAIYGMILSTVSESLPFKEDHAGKIAFWLLSSVTQIAPIIGAYLAGLSIDSVGRKFIMVRANVILIFGCVFIASKPLPWVIVVSRVLIGIGFGLVSVATPLFLVECSPSEIRGGMTSVNSSMMSLGQLIPYALKLPFKTMVWRISFFTAALITCIQTLVLFFLEESPYVSCMKNNSLLALKFFGKIHPAVRAEREHQRLTATINELKAIEDQIGTSFVEKLKSAVRNAEVKKTLVLGIVIQIVPQLVGNVVVTFFNTEVMQMAGFKARVVTFGLPLLCEFIGSGLNFIIMDKYGRRPTVLISLLIIVINLLCLGMLFEIHQTNQALGKMAVFLSGIYTIVYIPGMSTAPMLLNVEIYSFAYRGVGSSIGAMSSWFVNWIVWMAFSNFKKLLGTSAIFFFNGLIGLIGLIILYLMLPETKGVGLEEMGSRISNFRPWPLHQQEAVQPPNSFPESELPLRDSIE